MKQFLITAAGVFAGLLIFLIGTPLVLVAIAINASGPQATPAKAVLELDMRDPLTDQSPQNPLSGIGHRSNSVMTIVETLHRAEKDDRVMIKRYEDLVYPELIVHAFYVKYLLPIYFDVQSMERPRVEA